MDKARVFLYHGNCLDGFAAAWAAWRAFGDAAEYVPCLYGQAPPDVTGKHVALLDFSYKRAVLEDMVQTAASVTVLDHHKTAKDDLTPLLESGAISGVFDMDRSGAVIAWQYFHHARVPRLLQYVQDYDLYRFGLADTKRIQAALASYTFDFLVFDALSRAAATPGWLARLLTMLLRSPHKSIADLRAEGDGILRQRAKDVSAAISATKRDLIIGGHRVPAVNAPQNLIDAIGDALGVEAPFVAVYYDTPRGRKFSLRSGRDQSNFDVSEIAKQFVGGGGHRNAASFLLPIEAARQFELPCTCAFPMMAADSGKHEEKCSAA